MRGGQIPQLTVYVDSPMALVAMDIYRRAVAQRWPSIRSEILDEKDPFDPGDLRLVHGAAESERLNEPDGGGRSQL